MVFDFPALTQQFQFTGKLEDMQPYGSGHINDTYVVRFRQNGRFHHYILQRINHHIFKHPDRLVDNIAQVTAHIRRKITSEGGNPARATVSLIPGVNGAHHAQTPNGEYWRAYHFIEGTHTVQKAPTLAHSYQSGRAFGKFLRLLADFPIDRLHITIPDFHHTPKRLQAFIQSVEKDSCNRAAAVQTEIDFVLHRAADASVIIDLHEQGLMPKRVTHNDTKFENVLIDNAAGEVVCVIDLDTVMPGFAVFDFGDAVRSGANTAVEDEPDISKVNFNVAVFEKLAHGFLDETRDVLTPIEFDHLAMGAKLITFEQAIRFLGDYINGDTYYKISRPNHNLDRARTQIKLVADMETQFEQMQQIVDMYRA